MKDPIFKKAVLIIVLLFLISIIAGTVAGYHLSTGAIIQQVRTHLKSPPGNQQFGLGLYFYTIEHNIVSSAILLLTFFLFGLTFILNTLLQGYYVGLTLALSLHIHDIALFLAGILPHGVLEFPAILLTESIGLYLSYKFLRKVVAKKHAEFRLAVKATFLFFVRIIVPLFLVAGLIEAFITPRLLLFVEQQEGHITPNSCHGPLQSPGALKLLRHYGDCKN